MEFPTLAPMFHGNKEAAVRKSYGRNVMECRTTVLAPYVKRVGMICEEHQNP